MMEIARTFRALTFVGAVGLAIVSCNDIEDLSNSGNPNLKPESEYFDFATTAKVEFNVNYGTVGSGALIGIFTQNPMSYDEDGSYVVNGEAAFKIFADANGRFNDEIELPKAVETVYVFSSNWGVPMCVEAQIVNGKVTINEDANKRNAPSSAISRVVSSPSVKLINSSKKVYALADWSNFGKITNDFNKIISDGSLTGNFITRVQNSLWQGQTEKSNDLNNQHLVVDTKHVNTAIAKAYKNESGQTVTIEDAELYLTFLTESGWNQNSLGYYYYKTDECPSNPDNLDKFMIFPNASVSGNAPYGVKGYYNTDYGKDNAPLDINRKVQLLYRDDTGNISTHFPAGYTIGYFIIQNAYSCNEEGEGGVDYGKTFIYSNKEWNNAYQGEQARFIALSTVDGTVVYGVEDGGDVSYEDVLFCIDADPNEAIQDPERPIIDPEKPIITTVETTYRTYAYEDIWPTGGDYDLNDVIIEHKRSVTFNNNNYVQKVEDTFVPVQKAGAATFVNAFAVQYNAGQRGVMTIPTGALDETETSSVILFSDAKTVRGQEFVVTRTFGEEALSKSDLIIDLNPFIIAKYVEGAEARTEVHMPKAKATSKANLDQIGKEDDAYYINKDGKHPFAIMIPVTTSSEEQVHFIPVTETVSIEKEYSDFEKWVESKGSTHNNWYLNYQPIR